MEQEKLFGIDLKEKKKEVKPKKKSKRKSKRKGVIEIKYSFFSTDIPERNKKKGDEYVSVDFSGHNEGSGNPCLNDKEADELVRQIYMKKSKDYKIEIRDLRNKQLKEREKFKDKKAKITIINDYVDDYTKDILDRTPIPSFSINFEREDSYLGGIGSSAFSNDIKREGLDKVRDRLVGDELNEMVFNGYNIENIEIVNIPRDEKQLEIWKKRHNEDIETKKEFAEKEIKQYSEKLKKALRIKYGYRVKIRVLKE